MVKVVGKDPKAIKQVTCKSCASILEYTLSEVKSYKAGDYSGDTWMEYYVDCPECGSKAITKGY